MLQVQDTSRCETMRQRSMSLMELPNPFNDDPTMYNPQSVHTSHPAGLLCQTEQAKFKNLLPIHHTDRNIYASVPFCSFICSLQPCGQAARWHPGSQGTQLPSQPISSLTTKQLMASPSWSPRNRWVDQIRNDNNLPPADLRRRAVSRGHHGATLQPLLAKRWHNKIGKKHNCYVTDSRRAPPWPHRMACLQRLAGTDPVSLRSCPVQWTWGRPGQRLQSPPSERPDARLTWQHRAFGAKCGYWLIVIVSWFLALSRLYEHISIDPDSVVVANLSGNFLLLLNLQPLT